MSFSDNLKRARKERGLSQEEFAELLEVSRQAVSKWELGDGYPEVEKLLLISSKLNVSLDALMETGIRQSDEEDVERGTSEIVITSPNENVIMQCEKVVSSQEFNTGKRSPKYALYGIKGTSLFGENTTFLGWYADKESISKEIAGIQTAIVNGEKSYELIYSLKTERRWGRILIIEE